MSTVIFKMCTFLRNPFDLQSILPYIYLHLFAKSVITKNDIKWFLLPTVKIRDMLFFVVLKKLHRYLLTMGKAATMYNFRA